MWQAAHALLGAVSQPGWVGFVASFQHFQLCCLEFGWLTCRSADVGVCPMPLCLMLTVTLIACEHTQDPLSPRKLCGGCDQPEQSTSVLRLLPAQAVCASGAGVQRPTFASAQSAFGRPALLHGVAAGWESVSGCMVRFVEQPTTAACCGPGNLGMAGMEHVVPMGPLGQSTQWVFTCVPVGHFLLAY